MTTLSACSKCRVSVETTTAINHSTHMDTISSISTTFLAFAINMRIEADISFRL
jgi:hypothetical protein